MGDILLPFRWMFSIFVLSSLLCLGAYTISNPIFGNGNAMIAHKTKWIEQENICETFHRWTENSIAISCRKKNGLTFYGALFVLHLEGKFN